MSSIKPTIAGIKTLASSAQKDVKFFLGRKTKVAKGEKLKSLKALIRKLQQEKLDPENPENQIIRNDLKKRGCSQEIVSALVAFQGIAKELRTTSDAAKIKEAERLENLAAELLMKELGI